MKRARNEPPSARVARTKELTGTDLAAVKVLVVGAGGIGCELVKNLVRRHTHLPRCTHPPCQARHSHTGFARRS
jgi:hypothetical protein